LPGYAGCAVRCWSAGLSGEPAGQAGKVWRYLAFRVFLALTGNGPVNRLAGLGCVTYFVKYQL